MGFVFYSVFIFNDNYEVFSILIGVFNKESMNEIFNIDNFNGKGIIEIINSKGKFFFIGKNIELIKDFSYKYKSFGDEFWV